MKDFLGQELAVDDTVVYVNVSGNNNSSELRTGVIVKITPKMVKVRPLKPRKWAGEGEDFERACWPDRLIRVTWEG